MFTRKTLFIKGSIISRAVEQRDAAQRNDQTLEGWKNQRETVKDILIKHL